MREGAVNVDGLVVGGVLGSTQLGFYQLAFNLGSLPQNTIGATLTRVLYAGFAGLAHGAQQLAAAVELEHRMAAHA